MIKRLTLIDFMAHARTEFDLSPGLNVLTGPNNTGKSAVVEALRCLTQNPSPRHFIRHGASEARVAVEMDDGTCVAWVRRPRYALYELTRPGAAAPEVFAKFGRTPPEEILAVLAINPVVLEGGEEVDVHIGNQREPVFLLNQPGSVVAGFFAASTEAAHLIAMQNLLTERTRKSKMEKRRLETQLASLAVELDKLAALPDLELRLGTAAEKETDLAARERETVALQALLAARDRLRDRIGSLSKAKDILAPLAVPPQPAPTGPLAETVARSEALSRRASQALRRQQALSRLIPPPALSDTASLDQRVVALTRAKAALAHQARKAKALDVLTAPPVPTDVAALAALAANLDDCRAKAARLARKDHALAGLPAPPEVADIRPVAEIVDAMTAVRAAMAATRADCNRKAQELAALEGRIAARLAELKACPLCGGQLSAAEFLGGRHEHNQATHTP
jgi:hypothetical protein